MDVFPAAQDWMDQIRHKPSFPIPFEFSRVRQGLTSYYFTKTGLRMQSQSLYSIWETASENQPRGLFFLHPELIELFSIRRATSATPFALEFDGKGTRGLLVLASFSRF